MVGCVENGMVDQEIDIYISNLQVTIQLQQLHDDTKIVVTYAKFVVVCLFFINHSVFNTFCHNMNS
jgi:hypothetical protein